MSDLTKYGFAENFELQVLNILCSPSGDAIITEIDHTSFDDPVTQWLIQAIKHVHATTGGRCPRDIAALAQGVHALHAQKKFDDQARINILITASTVFASAPPDKDGAYRMMVERVKHVASVKAIETGVSEFASTRDIQLLHDQVARVQSIGDIAVAPFYSTAESASSIIQAITTVKVGAYPLGIPALDNMLMGGICPGELLSILGDSNDGKSRTMNGICNVFLGRNLNCIWYSNEVDIAIQGSMHLGAALRRNTTKIQKIARYAEDTGKEFDTRNAKDPRGRWDFRFIPAGDWTMQQVLSDIDKREQELGIKFHAVFIDLIGKLDFGTDGDYVGIGRACDVGRNWAVDNGRVVITCHQAKERASYDDILHAGSGADSQRLKRASDMMLTINPKRVQNGDIDRTSRVTTINVPKVRSAEGLPPFQIDRFYEYACLSEMSIGWRPKASLPSYDPQKLVEDFLSEQEGAE